MKTTAAKVPKGFDLLDNQTDLFVISYKATGMIGAKIFLMVWLTFWTFGCVMIGSGIFTEHEIGLVLFAIPFFAAEVAVIGILLWMFFGKTYFHFRDSSLMTRRVLFFWKREKHILQSDIEVVRQIKDGGEGEDSFPSWGLVMEGERNIKILSKQEIEKSSWLGPIIAEWANVEYIPCEIREYESI